MRQDTRFRYSTSFGSSFPPGVRWLLFTNVGIFILGFILELTGFADPFAILGLNPHLFIHGALWQIGTYMFIHSMSEPFHILFNMLALWMFGSAIERTWGTRRFIRYYLYCGLGAGVCVVIAGLLFNGGRTIGASGAVYGLLLAFGMLFPDTIVYLIIFPIKAKYLVMIMGALAFFYSIKGGNDNISNIAHLGGLLTGFLILRMSLLRGDMNSLQDHYKQWKLSRAKRKFQVYMKKHDSTRGPWVN